MKLSQKELEMLSSVDIEQVIDDLWGFACAPSPAVASQEEREAHKQRRAIFMMAVSATSGRQRRVIERLIEKAKQFTQNSVIDATGLQDIKEELKEAFRGEFRNPMKHQPSFSTVKELFVIQLLPAFPGHPEFPVTYYAGYSLPTKGVAQTHDIDAAARWTARDEAQNVADKLLPAVSCVWKVVEA